MIVLCLSGMLCSIFAILSFYPVFTESNILAAIIFILSSIVFYFLFFYTKRNSKGHNKITKSKECEESKKSNLDKNNIAQVIFLTLTSIFITLVFQSIGLWICIEIFSRISDLKIVSNVFSFLFTIINKVSTNSNGNIHLSGLSEYIYTFTPNPHNTGIYYFIMFISGFLPFLLLIKNKIENLSGIICSLFYIIIFFFLRTVIMVFIFLSIDMELHDLAASPLALFWLPFISIVSLLPLLVTGLIFNKNYKIINIFSIFNNSSFKRDIVNVVILSASIVSIMFLLFWSPVGEQKSGRILIEEYYSGWTKSDKAIDDKWYGDISTYNYYTMRKFLSSYYDVVINNKNSHLNDLDNYDVLIIKIPTKAYPDYVIDNIVNFVKNGGGLWVIGDHTNVFGSTTYLNPLIKRIGIILNEDGVYHNETGSFNNYFVNQPVSHPIMKKVPVFLFATSCSMQIKNINFRIVIPGLTTKAYKANYSIRNFFPDTKPDLNIRSGSNVLMTAGEYGKGKVVVFTDSTVFSNFFFYLPGKAELALSTVIWLNSKNSFFIIKILLFISFLFFAGVFLVRQLKSKTKYTYMILFFSLLISISFLPIINFLNDIAYKLPEERRSIPKVLFSKKYSNIYLPSEKWEWNNEKDFNTFYIWAQRTGLRTVYSEEFGTNLEKFNAVFFILPNSKFTKNDLKKIDGYLKKGGKVFIFDNNQYSSSSNQLLKNYDLNISTFLNTGGDIEEIDGERITTTTLPVAIIEGSNIDEIILNYNFKDIRNPIFIKKDVGKGQIYFFGGVSLFSTKNFGESSIVPEGENKNINNLILRIYRAISE